MEHRAPKAEDWRALAEAMRAALAREEVVGNVAYDEANQRLLNESIEAIPLAGLMPAWLGAEGDDAKREDLVTRYVRAHVRGRQPIDAWEEAATRVLPLVRPELEFVAWKLREPLEGTPVPSMPTGAMSEHLRLRFVYEIEDGTANVFKEDVDRWGIDLDTLQDAAAGNLLRRTPGPVEWLGSPESPGVYRTSWRDGFDATRVVMTRDLDLPLGGPPVAIALSGTEVYVADSADESALFQLGLIGQRAAQRANEMIWLWPLLLEGETRRHWLPAEESAGYAPLSVCAAQHAMHVYAAHGALFERVLRAEGSAMPVGPVGMIQSPLGAAATVAVWPQAASPVAVGRADFIQFRRGEEALGLAPLARVEEVMGPMFEAMPGYPPRFRAHVFPEPWQLDQLDLQGGAA